MTHETFYKAKNLIEDISNLDYAKNSAKVHMNVLIDADSLQTIFHRIHWHDQNMYKSILKDISDRLEARLVELNIELQAI
jgi:hypothetical protein